MNDFSVCTILFDGQFWIAVITRFQAGKYYEARYTFGPEPTGPQILQWVDSTLSTIPFVQIEKPTALKKLFKPSYVRSTSKDQYKQADQIRLEALRMDKKAQQDKACYQQKREKRKAKHKH